MTGIGSAWEFQALALTYVAKDEDNQENSETIYNLQENYAEARENLRSSIRSHYECLWTNLLCSF